MQPFVSYLALLRWYRFRPRWSNYAGSFPDRDQHGSDRGDDDRPEDREHRPTTVTDRILEKSTPCSANQTELSEAQVFFRDKHSRRPGLVAPFAQYLGQLSIWLLVKPGGIIQPAGMLPRGPTYPSQPATPIGRSSIEITI